MIALEEQIKEYYTTDYIYSLPDGKRAELIDGVIYDLASPNRKHQGMVLSLCQKIANYIDSKNENENGNENGNCKVYPAPFAVFLNNDNKTYVEPDISVICDKDKLNDKGCGGAPDWIIEIVSSGSRQMDYMIKLFKYKEACVKEYWIVDIEKNRVTVYNFQDETVEEHTLRDKVKAGIYEDFEIDFNSISI